MVCSETLKNGMRLVIKDGKKIAFWHDIWLGSNPFINLTTQAVP